MQDRRRRGIKKAQSYGLTIRKSEDFDNYWRMVEKLLELRYKEKPVHTIDEIQRLHFLFPKNIKLFACVKKSTMLAGVLIYESDKVAHVQYIASNASGRKLGALDLTFHYLLTDYYRHKPYFDFGISNEDQGHYLNKGLIDQKEGFGARAVVHDQYKIDLLIWEPDKILSASNK